MKKKSADLKKIPRNIIKMEWYTFFKLIMYFFYNNVKIYLIDGNFTFLRKTVN